MKHIRTTLALATLSLAATNAYADPLTVYGKANVSVQSSDEGEGNFTETKSNASRFGVKGDYELDNGLSAVYLFEWQVDLTDESGEENIKSRNQYVGLKGDFGTVLVGRIDTVLKKSQGKIDLFSDYEADIKQIWKGENRMSDTVTYMSPKFNMFQFGVTYIAEDGVDGEDATSFSLTYGDSKLKKSKIYASIAHDADVKGYDITRASIQGKFDAFKLGAMYQTQEADGADSKDGFMVSAAYSMGKATLKAQHQTLEDDDSSSLGVDYKLGKNTKAYLWYSTLNFESKDDRDYLALGMEHKF